MYLFGVKYCYNFVRLQIACCHLVFVKKSPSFQNVDIFPELDRCTPCVFIGTVGVALQTEMDRKGPKWTEMSRNGPKWAEMYRNGELLFQISILFFSSYGSLSQFLFFFCRNEGFYLSFN